MSVTNQTIKNEQKELVDDVSHLEIKNEMSEEPKLDESVMEALKLKMAAKMWNWASWVTCCIYIC